MPDPPPVSEGSNERLDSWKEIAAYLGRQVRTVQGWERDEGLPIHRLPHKSKGSVFAYMPELDAWRARHAMPPPTPPPLNRSRKSWARPVAAPMAGAILLILGVLAWSRLRPASRTSTAAASSSLRPLTERYLATSTRAGGHPTWIATSMAPSFLALDRSNQSLYSAGRDGRIERISTANDRVVGQWTLPGQVGGMAVGLDGQHLYLAGLNPVLYVLNLAIGQLQEVSLPGAAVALNLSRDGQYLYLAMPYEGLERVETSSLQTTHWSVPPCPISVAPDADNGMLIVGFQCNGPGGTPGHDAIGIYNSLNGQLISSLVGEPRVGRTVALNPGGNEIWTDSGTACEEPQYDHRGCSKVPSEMLEVLGLSSRQTRVNRAIAGGPGAPTYGMIAFFPGGARAFDGNYIVDTTRLNALEVLPSVYSVIGAPVIPSNGSHAYVVLSHAGTQSLADFTPTPEACAPSSRDLLDWWPGDGSADDAWGIENAKLSPSAAYAPGLSGQAFDLTRPGAAITIGPDHGLDFRLLDVTLSAWIKLPSLGPPRPILSKMEVSGHAGWSLSLNDAGHPMFCQGRAGATDCYTAPLVLAPGGFHFLALRASQHWVEIYFDGSLAGRTRLGADSNAGPGTPLLLGTDATHTYFLAGWLDEVMVYTRALGPEEIASMARLPACLAENHH